MVKKEYGSDFCSKVPAAYRSDSDPLLRHPGLRFYMSGRSALHHLIAHGIACYGWEKLFIPDYYCHDVVSFIRELPIEISYYSDSPLEPEVRIPVYDGNSAAVVVSYFGQRRRVAEVGENCHLLEDLTHNLSLLTASTAAYSFASLRKELPLAAGGVARASQGAVPLPAPSESAAGKALVETRSRGMALKGQYLQGKPVAKEQFRKLLTETEASFADPATNGALPANVVAHAQTLDTAEMSQVKQRNIAYLLSRINRKEICVNFFNKNLTFGLILVFPTKTMRDLTKNYLIEHTVYPAVLWPGQHTPAAADLQDRLLFIHADYRHTSADLEAIAQHLNFVLK